MSLMTNKPLKVTPSAAVAPTVTCGTAWVFGSRVELNASMSAASQLAGLHFDSNSTGTFDLEFGIGSAGNEVGFSNILINLVPANIGTTLLMLPVPIDAIPAGGRLSVRARRNLNGATAAIAAHYYQALDSDHKTTSPYNYVPFGADGVSVTPNASPWANSALFELTSGLVDESAILGVAPHTGLGIDVEWEIDLGTGSAGSEVVITTLRSDAGRIMGYKNRYLPRPFPVAPNTRIACRLRKSDTTVTAVPVHLLYLGDVDLLNPVVPEVDTLSVTGQRSTQARLRGRIDPNLIAVTGRFAWGTVGSPLALDTETAPQVIGAGDLFITFSELLTGLTPNTTYYYRAIANDGVDDYFGDIVSFETAGEQAFVDGEVSYPLAWLELTKRDGDMKPFAEVDLNDAPTYYGGYKAPWVKRFHGISRGLSDRDGQIEHMTFGALFADTGRFFRGLLEDAVNKYLTNRPLVERFIDDEDRRVEGLPRIAAVGYVNDYAPTEDLQFDLKGSDWLKKKFSRKRKAQQSWQPLITRDDFPNCSDDVVNTAAPLIYGSLGLSGADPVENVQITVNAQPGAAPGSFAISTVAGGRYAGVTTYYIVSAMVAGQETQQAGPLVATTDNTNRTNRLTWAAVPGATAINVYSSHRPDFAQFYYQTLAGGATTLDDSTTPINDADRAPWNVGLRLNLTYYVYANLGAGVFSRPGVASMFIAPIPYDTWQVNGLEQRDIDVTYDAHPDETDGYRVVRRRSYYSDWDPRFDRQWDPLTGVLSVTDDAITNTAVDVPAGELVAAAAAGQVEAIPIGRFDFNGTPLNGLLLCRCASARVGKVYVPVTTENVDGENETTYEPVAESEFGSTWFAQDHAGWLYANKYVDINGRRYTLIGTTVDPLPAKVLVDVDGIETDGDGLGDVIRSIVRQLLHFKNNFIAPDTPYASGAYLTAADTTFPHIPDLPLVDEASHDDAEAALEDRLPGGYEGAGIIGAGGEFISATDVLAWFHVSADVDQVFNRKGQDTISAEPIALEIDPPVISDVINIKDGSFSLADQVQNAFFNILPFVHTRDYTRRTPSGWYGVGEERSQTSIDNYDQERESPRFELQFLRANTTQGAATIVDSMARKKARYMDPQRVGTLTMPFEGLTYEPGRVVAINAVEGIGASGWNGRQVRLKHHNASASDGQIVLDFYDLELVLENQGSP